MDQYLEAIVKLMTIPNLIAGGILAFALVQLRNHKLFRWFLFTLLIFTSSLKEFIDPWDPIRRPLIPGMEQLRAYGRPITILLLAVIYALPFIASHRRNSRGWHPAIYLLLVVQLLIVIKTLLFGSKLAGLLILFTFLLVLFSFSRGPISWLQNDKSFRQGILAMAMVAVLFVFANGIQYLLFKGALFLNNGRFHGTTSNPLHATVLLGVLIPAILFMFRTSSAKIKLFWLLVLVLDLFFLLATGSRTGLVLAFINFGIVYMDKIKFTRLVYLGTFSFFIFVLFFVYQQSNLDGYQTYAYANTSQESTIPIDRLGSTENTRSHVWRAQWNSFIRNPIFGQPLWGGRLGFGENSWLAVAASLGIIGFIPMLIMGGVLLSMCQDLYFRWKITRDLRYQVVLATLLSLLAGSILEAYLLATLSFPLFVLLFFVTAGDYLLKEGQA